MMNENMITSTSQIPTIKSLQDIDAFIKSEESKYGIKFLKTKVYVSKSAGICERGKKNDDGSFNIFLKRTDYNCNRNGKARIKVDADRRKKIGTKKLGKKGCPARISFTEYENIPEIEVKYVREHSHE